MSTNEIISKARKLYDEENYERVVEVLKEYVKGNCVDRVALALYYKSSITQTFLDEFVDTQNLYGSAEERYKNLSDEETFRLSCLRFTNLVAHIFLSEDTEEKKRTILFSLLEDEILALGDRLNDYELLKKQLDQFFSVLLRLGYGNDFYKNLSAIVDWNSKASENILHYLVAKSKEVPPLATDKEIYDAYTKDMKSDICAYEEKPTLNGDKLVNTNIKSEEEKEFWKGYFEYVKQVRQEEYEVYKQTTSSENSELFSAYSIGDYVHRAYINAIMKRTVSSDEVAKMQVATGCHMIVDRTETEYKVRILNAEKAYNAVKVNPIAQIKGLINKFFEKK